MKKALTGAKIAILLCDGFEEVEMTKPRDALKKAGATTYLITPENKAVKGWNHDHWTKSYKVNKTLKTAKASDYDAIVLPGGVINPDRLRTYKSAVKFINQFMKAKKPIAAICHGPMTLIETGKLKGLKMTSYPSIKTDLVNAGVKWSNKKVIVDKNFVTSRKPSDIPAFNKAVINLIAKSAKMNGNGRKNGVKK